MCKFRFAYFEGNDLHFFIKLFWFCKRFYFVKDFLSPASFLLFLFELLFYASSSSLVDNFEHVHVLSIFLSARTH